MHVPVLGKAVDVSSLPSSFWHCIRQAASKESFPVSLRLISLCPASEVSGDFSYRLFLSSSCGQKEQWPQPVILGVPLGLPNQYS